MRAAGADGIQAVGAVEVLGAGAAAEAEVSAASAAGETLMGAAQVAVGDESQDRKCRAFSGLDSRIASLYVAS